MPDRQAKGRQQERTAGGRGVDVIVAPAAGDALARGLSSLRVEDDGGGMARVAVSQLLPHDVALRIAAILGEEAAVPHARGGVAALSGRMGQRRRRPSHDRRWTAGS